MNAIKTYIGFSIKKGDVIFGLDSVLVSRKKIFLLLVCKTTKENTLKKTREFAAKKQIALIVPPMPLAELTARENVKILALTDFNLAAAIQKNLAVETEEKN